MNPFTAYCPEFLIFFTETLVTLILPLLLAMCQFLIHMSFLSYLYFFLLISLFSLCCISSSLYCYLLILNDKKMLSVNFELNPLFSFKTHCISTYKIELYIINFSDKLHKLHNERLITNLLLTLERATLIFSQHSGNKIFRLKNYSFSDENITVSLSE